MNKEKFYITTAIDYTNARPHIGHALEKVQADVLARYARLKGREVWFLTGTDEHGVKVVRAAEAAGKNPEDFVNALAEDFKGLREALDLSWDDFIRTTDEKRHFPGAVLLWRKLTEAGDIYKKKYRGLYCVGHEAFVTEKDLVDGKCEDHGKAPEVVEEENYFFKLSKYSKRIGEAVRSGKLAILPEGRKNEILSLIEKKGLEDVSFSRPRKDLSWGIPVPGDDAQTMYVWCDALTNYLSAIGYGRSDDWKKWWPAEVQVIGKDILRFHAAIWPGMLLAAGLELPKAIYVHGFVNVDGKKISKSLGNVIDPLELVKKYGTDAVRYYLLKEIPSGEDGDFSIAKFEAAYNGDLANGLGNFARRVLVLAQYISKGEMYEIKVDEGIGKVNEVVQQRIAVAKKTVEDKVVEFKLREAIQAIWSLVSFGDGYLNERKPWSLSPKDLFSQGRQDIFDVTYILDNIAGLLSSFLPETSEKITNAITWGKDSTLTIKKGEVLFPRLS